MTEGSEINGISPKDTAWAVGSLANFNTLTYGPCPFQQGHTSRQFAHIGYVVHLVAEDIYLSITVNSWGNNDGGSFSYTRSTPAVVVSPTVAITSPTNNSSFVAPATLPLSATAAVSGGTVTNVQFFANGVSLGSVTNSPFNLTSPVLTSTNYTLTAVATAGGVSTTSAPINFSVINPPPTVALTNPTNNATFAAPANLKLSATASATVTNVQFFASGALLGNVTNSPFNFTSPPLAASNGYALTAVATAGGVSTTSAPVNISVVTPVASTASSSGITNGNFNFSYTATPGLTYIVQSSSDLSTWQPVVTNTPVGSPVQFTTPFNTGSNAYFRVALQPNP